MGGQASDLIFFLFKNGASLFDFVFKGRQSPNSLVWLKGPPQSRVLHSPLWAHPSLRPPVNTSIHPNLFHFLPQGLCTSSWVCLGCFSTHCSLECWLNVTSSGGLPWLPVLGDLEPTRFAEGPNIWSYSRLSCITAKKIQSKISKGKNGT